MVSADPRRHEGGRRHTTINLIQSTPNLSIIQLLRALSYRFEHERIRIDSLIYSKDVEDNARCRSIVTTSNDHSVANDEEKLSFVVVGESCE